jgi:hypothetical protein
VASAYFEDTFVMSIVNFNSTWRPLPAGLTIKSSSVEGLGLFATEDFEAGTELGLIRTFYSGDWMRTPLGGFINHSYEPNCKGYASTNELGDRCVYLETKVDIKAGDELVLWYDLPEYINERENLKTS